MQSSAHTSCGHARTHGQERHSAHHHRRQNADSREPAKHLSTRAPQSRLRVRRNRAHTHNFHHPPRQRGHADHPWLAPFAERYSINLAARRGAGAPIRACQSSQAARTDPCPCPARRGGGGGANASSKRRNHRAMTLPACSPAHQCMCRVRVVNELQRDQIRVAASDAACERPCVSHLDEVREAREGH